ncbi:hypothetical protein, partial [Helicobacter pylori]|uniref:hypothetical protein n=1 Tax=Helicobacter pylori TaxID=210 RepID=UPI0029299288
EEEAQNPAPEEGPTAEQSQAFGKAQAEIEAFKMKTQAQIEMEDMKAQAKVVRENAAKDALTSAEIRRQNVKAAVTPAKKTAKNK